MNIWPHPRIFLNSRIKVCLANDLVTTLLEYIKILVNVQEIEAVIRVSLVDVEVYDLFLGVS